MSNYDWVRTRACKHIMEMNEDELIQFVADSLACECEICPVLWNDTGKYECEDGLCQERVKELLEQERMHIDHGEITAICRYDKEKDQYYAVIIDGMGDRYVTFSGKNEEELVANFERIIEDYNNYVRHLDEIIDKAKPTPCSLALRRGLGTAICLQKNKENENEWDCQFRYLDKIEERKLHVLIIDFKFIEFVEQQEEEYYEKCGLGQDMD